MSVKAFLGGKRGEEEVGAYGGAGGPYAVEHVYA